MKNGKSLCQIYAQVDLKPMYYDSSCRDGVVTQAEGCDIGRIGYGVG